MKKSSLKLSFIVVISLTIGVRSNCQSDPEEYKKGTISEQLDKLEAHTRIYENFRAIREDIFQIIGKNVKDSMARAKRRINNLTFENTRLNSQIDSINKSIEATKSSMEEISRTKNSISVLGLEVNKITYNSVTWSILGILVFLLVTGYLIFRKNWNTTFNAKKELVDLQKEYEDYRKKKSLEHQQMTVSHFNEIKKLKEEFTKSKR